jgi:thioredoxin 1
MTDPSTAPGLSAIEAPSRAEIDAWPGLTLLAFGTGWCGHCRAAQPLLSDLLALYPQWRHVNIEDGSGRALGRSFGVRLWPTWVLLQQGQVVGQWVRPAALAQIQASLPESLRA